MDAIPLLTLKRLPKYLEALYRFKRAGLKMVSATKIAVFTDVHMTQVRKDLSYTGVVGVPKVGHKIDSLITAIEDCLNWNDVSSCFLGYFSRQFDDFFLWKEFLWSYYPYFHTHFCSAD